MVNGFFTWPTLYRDMIQRFPSGSHFVEIGVLEGQSLIYLIKEKIKSGKTIRITGVDHFIDQSGGLLDKFNANLADYPNDYDLMVMDSVEASCQLGTVDFVFIDAAHDYDAVKRDILAWLPKTRGIIAGHDYIPTFPGVMQSVDEIFGGSVNKNYAFEGCWLVNIG